VLADRYLGSCDDPAELDRGGWWAVVVTFEGDVRLHRFGRTRRLPLPTSGRRWSGPPPTAWASSLVMKFLSAWF